MARSNTAGSNGSDSASTSVSCGEPVSAVSTVAFHILLISEAVSAASRVSHLQTRLSTPPWFGLTRSTPHFNVALLLARSDGVESPLFLLSVPGAGPRILSGEEGPGFDFI